MPRRPADRIYVFWLRDVGGGFFLRRGYPCTQIEVYEPVRGKILPRRKQ